MEFEGYPESFQLEVLKLIYHDPEFARMVTDTIKPELFEIKEHAVYAEIFLNFYKSYPDAFIDRPVVFIKIKELIDRKIIPEEKKRDYIEVFSEILKKPDYPGFVKDEIRKFIANKEVEIEIINSSKLVKKGKFDEIFNRFAELQTKLQGGSKFEDCKVIRDAENHIKKYEDPDFKITKDGMPTSVGEMDKLLFRNGVGKKEMMVFCGSPGRGKSIALVNASIATILSGFNVLFYTLEVSSDIVLERIYSCLTGIPIVQLADRIEEFRERITIIKKAFPKMGEITLLDYPPRWLTANKIKSEIKNYAMKGVEFDMITVDYADIMASDSKITERRLEHGDVYERLRGVAKEFNVAVITASQANRTALRKREVDIDALSEDFSKSFTADFVLGLSQDATEEKERLPDGRGTGKMRWFIGKNRNGVKGKSVEMMTDYTRMRASIADWDAYDIEVFGYLTN